MDGYGRFGGIVSFRPHMGYQMVEKVTNARHTITVLTVDTQNQGHPECEKPVTAIDALKVQFSRSNWLIHL